MPEAESTSEFSRASSAGKIVARNTLLLGIAEVLSMPLSILLNATMARYLGPAETGQLYLAWTIAGLAYLLVCWGHNGSLPALIVRERASAGLVLGTTLLWRVVGATGVYTVVALGCSAIGFSRSEQWALGLVFLVNLLGYMLAACQDSGLALERADVAAYARVGLQLASTLLVTATLILGGGMRAALLAQAAAGLLAAIAAVRMLAALGIGRLGWSWPQLKALMVGGTPFAMFSLVLVLQPNVDALYLAKLTSPEVVGWYSVARRLSGVLIVPVNTLVGALYPTLLRLAQTDPDGFRRTARDALSTVTLLVMPVALGCALYPDLGVSIFGRADFGPAEQTLIYNAPFLFLVYFSMPIGCALTAARRQRAWALVQLGTVVVNAVLDPFLIEHFQERYGNGGIGLAVAGGLSELFAISAGIALAPRGMIDRTLVRTFMLSGLSAAAMATCALVLRPLPSLLAAPLSLAVYASGLHVTGALSAAQLGELASAVRSKLRRRTVAPG